jgi:hypothetical protein
LLLFVVQVNLTIEDSSLELINSNINTNFIYQIVWIYYYFVIWNDYINYWW